MNIVKALPADATIGSEHGTSCYSIRSSCAANNRSHGAGSTMSFVDVLLTLLRWKNTGWEVHPINLDSEFQGWI